MRPFDGTPRALLYIAAPSRARQKAEDGKSDSLLTLDRRIGKLANSFADGIVAAQRQ